MSDQDLEIGITVDSIPTTVSNESVAGKEDAVTVVDEMHSTQELLKRAREVNASGQFIFSGFSELTVFLLLRSQDHILRLQRKLHASVASGGPWCDEDANELRIHLKEYHEMLSTHKTVLSWDRPPFKDSHSASEFLFGKCPLTPSDDATGSTSPALSETLMDGFAETDYVDLCPETSNIFNTYFRRRLPVYFRYKAEQRRVVTQMRLFRSQHKDAPAWRGSSATVERLARVLLSIVTVLFLVAPMFALTYIHPTEYILLAAALFAGMFGVAFALSSRAKDHEIVGVTAAYAAVLMVFVGNAIPTPIIQGTVG